jgi:hypothetical protein
MCKSNTKRLCKVWILNHGSGSIAKCLFYPNFFFLIGSALPSPSWSIYVAEGILYGELVLGGSHNGSHDVDLLS